MARKRTQGSDTATSHSEETVSAGGRMLTAGLALAIAGVPFAMDPTGYNLFGPVKGVVLALSAATCAMALALDPAPLVAAWRVLRRSPAMWAAAALAVLVAISTATSLNPLRSLTGGYPEYAGLAAMALWSIIGVAAASAAAAATPQSVQRHTLWRALTASALLISLYGIAQRLGIDPVTYRAGLDLARARSTLGNASNLGLYLAVVLPLLAWRARPAADPHAGWRTAAYAAAGASALALLLTESRGAWLALVLACAVALALSWRTLDARTRKRALGALAGLAVVLVVATLLLSQGSGERAQAAADPSGGTAAWRTAVWGSAARIAADRPLTGVGPDAFRLAYPLHRPAQLAEDAADPKIVANAHNIVMHTAAENGIPAALALLAALALIAFATWRARTRGSLPGTVPLAPLAASAAAGVVALQFHFLTLDTGPILFALLGVLSVRTAEEPASSPHTASGAVPLGLARGVMAAAAVASLVVALAMGGAVVADHALGGGFELVAQAGAGAETEWRPIASRFDAAAKAVPWDASVRWAKGSAAVRMLAVSSDPAIHRDGAAALDAAARRMPRDTALMEDRADLELAQAISSADPAYAEEAQTRYEALLELDPSNGVLWTGLGSAQAGTGDWEAAVESYERGVELTPSSVAGWANLAVAYERVGRGQDALEARARGADLLK